NSPDEFVFAVCTAAVALSVRETVAPAMAAPLGSTTLPVTSPLLGSCAREADTANNTIANVHTTAWQVRILIWLPPRRGSRRSARHISSQLRRRERYNILN